MPNTSTRRATPLDIHIGRRLRMARLARKISQTALADALGVTFQQVQKYEWGVNRIGAGRLPVVAATLGVSLDFFYEGVPSPVVVRGKKRAASNGGTDPRELIEQVMQDRIGQRLLQAFAKIKDNETKYSVVRLVEQIVAAS
jgi:transcriptional regulator with XRE-family HTH domain